jgi:hypothetical protein
MNNIISEAICIDATDIESFTDLENEFEEEIKKAFKQVAEKVIKLKEEDMLKEGKYTKKTKVSRYLYTRYGQIKYERYKAEKNGKYSFPLDRYMKIKKNSSFSPQVEKRAIQLCLNYPYRQARDILSYEIEAGIDHRSLWRLIQKEGKTLRESKKEGVERLYTDAKGPDSEAEGQEIVVIEADGTGISSQQGKGRWMEAKIGIIYTGKKLESETAKHKRFLLENKCIYADILDMDEFGKNLSYIAQKNYNLSEAENVLLISDGDRRIRELGVGYLPGSVHQLDHFHLKRKLRQLYSHSPDLLSRALGLIYRREEDKLIPFIRLSKVNGAIEEEAADEAMGYIEDNLSSIWAIDRLRGKAPKEVLVVGSGAIEKNVDTAIARRFKGRGMSWSSRGARNLMAFRMLALNDEFDRYFSRRAA